MAEHPIQGLMNVTMEKIHQMVDSNTIIGKPIITEDGTTILPVSKVSFGFASGGTDFDGKNAANKDLFGGGSGAGVNIQPVAFLVVKDGCVRTIQLSDNADTINRALTMLPELVDKVAALIKKDEKKEEPAAPAAASKTQAIAKRLLGAATRRCSRRKLPAGLLTTIAVTVSFQLTVLIQAHPHPKAGERCAF